MCNVFFHVVHAAVSRHLLLMEEIMVCLTPCGLDIHVQNSAFSSHIKSCYGFAMDVYVSWGRSDHKKIRPPIVSNSD